MALSGDVLSGQLEDTLNNVSDGLPLQCLTPYNRQHVIQIRP